MATESPITRAAGWFLGEAKTFNITVTDEAGQPVVLTGANLYWHVSRFPGQPLLTKTDGAGITIVGDDNDVASIDVDETDYEDLEAGVYRHELIDLSSNLVLAYGDAWILQAAFP